jgi:hypothetical protein
LYFTKLAHDFYSGELNMASINIAFITLIPETNDPKTMNDFRPISLISLPLKFITKLLANRVQKEIIPTLHQNQYGFIRGKSIHGCLGWACGDMGRERRGRRRRRKRGRLPTEERPRR